MAQKGFIGWSIVVLPILLINLVTWASRQGRPLVSFLGAACAVVGAGLILYLFRGPLFGLLPGRSSNCGCSMYHGYSRAGTSEDG
jgi:hypothetical protein